MRYTYDRKAQIESAEIDPGHQLWLDRNFYDNSYTDAPDTRATTKLMNIVRFTGEWFSQLLAWLG